jgi:hypothetical protein
MSVGDLKTDGLKGNNFPWQLKMLLGQQCACDQLTEINANTDDVEFLLSAILTTLQANTEYEAKFVVDTCNSDTVYLEVRVWNPDTSTWGPITYYLPGSDTPVIPPGAATPGCLIYTDPSGVLALILGAIQAGNLILTDIETNTGDTVTELQNLLALYTAGQSACADSLSVTLCTEQGLSLSAIENNTAAIAISTAAIDLDTTSIANNTTSIDINTANIDTNTVAIDIATTAISADTTTIVSQLNSQVKTPVIKRITGATLGISVQIQSISIACPATSSTYIIVSTDNVVNFVNVYPGETVYYDAGALNNYFAANLFYIDTTAGGEALITYII